MSPQPSYQKPRQGSMGPFWMVIGLAVVCLIVYAVVFVGKAKGSGSKGKIIPEEKRDAVPSRALEALPPATGSVKVTAMSGKVVVLHFWASWCGPCQAEFPDFSSYADKARTLGGVVVLPVSTDINAENATGFLSQMGAKTNAYLDSGGLSQELGVAYIPTTILVDKKGRIAWRSTGAADWSPKGVPALVETLMTE